MAYRFLGMAYWFLGIKLLPGTQHLFLGIGRMFPGTPKLFLGTFWLLGTTPPFLGTLERFLGMPKIRTNKFLFHSFFRGAWSAKRGILLRAISPFVRRRGV